jgi:ankyrin repeat protein
VAEIRRLIRQGADVNAGREHEISGHSFESTPLLVAVTNPSLEISTLLIEAGADVNCKGPWGCTPLMLAVFLESSSPEIVTLLIEAGADVNARTEDEPGTTPMSVLQCALLAESPDPEIIQLLKAAGAK